MQLTINVDNNQHKTMQFTKMKIIINICNLQLMKILINTKQCNVQLMEIIIQLKMNEDND